MDRNQGGVAGLLGALAVLSGACATSSFQSAKLQPVGGMQVTAAIANYSGFAEGENAGENGFEGLFAYGVTDQFELGGKLTLAHNSDLDPSFFYTAQVIPKLALMPQKLALVLPVGVGFSSEDKGFGAAPGVVYTLEINQDFDFDAAGQAVYTVDDSFDDSEYYIGGTGGLVLSPGAAPWGLHVEIGFLIPLDDAADLIDYFIQYGIGFEYRFGGPAPPP